jgi:hypothetical protein
LKRSATRTDWLRHLISAVLTLNIMLLIALKSRFQLGLPVRYVFVIVASFLRFLGTTMVNRLGFFVHQQIKFHIRLNSLLLIRLFAGFIGAFTRLISNKGFGRLMSIAASLCRAS